MTKKVMALTGTERMARVIAKCYSPATLAIAADAMGVKLPPRTDIFRALVIAKRAADYDEAVKLVAAYLDMGTLQPDVSDDLVNGRIERRQCVRSR